MKKHKTRGQAMVEFALVLPIFAILLFGIIDIGRYVYTANALSNGAREGARAGSVANRPSPTCDGLTRGNCIIAVAGANSWGVPAANVTTVPTCERIQSNGSIVGVAIDSCRSNDLLRVKSTTTFTLVTPIIAQFIGAIPQVGGETRVTVNQ